MSVYQKIAILGGFAFFYMAMSVRIERTIISGALVFAAFGLVCGPYGLHLLDLSVNTRG